MANAASFFIRALADMFPGKATAPRENTPASAASQSAQQPQTHTPEPGPHVLGRGGPDETLIFIGGIPNLFVDEGDCVKQFEPAFDEAMKETQFGMKVLPELEPHWSEVVEHRCSVKEAIADAIRGSSRKPVARETTPIGATRTSAPARVREAHAVLANDDDSAAVPRRPVASGTRGSDMDAVTGTVTGWGEEKFPRRNATGPRFYTSFAIRLDTLSGERVLQGEGLKDAISESGCQVGDVISVRRLRKIKVQAFDNGGSPITRDGKPVLWDKWLWSISK